jgi:uncharacterized protein (DUF433 family)
MYSIIEFTHVKFGYSRHSSLVTGSRYMYRSPNSYSTSSPNYGSIGVSKRCRRRRPNREQIDVEAIYNEAAAMDHRGVITIEPGKMNGKPCIRGLRITVNDIPDYLASGMTEAEILADFPDLTLEDIRACLALAAARG